MAGTATALRAEQLGIVHQPEDFACWEAELATQLPHTDQLPEHEVYGRSLSTIRRLGNFMIGRMHQEAVVSPEAQQAKVEFFTSVEEGFGTDMELGGGLEVRDFDERSVINGRVMAKDLKTPISRMTQDGLVCAEATLKKDRRFLPQYVRSVWDHENALVVDAMASGGTGYNTRIVVSPFPEEAAADSGDEYWRNIGYVPHLRRGFVQLYHVNESGVLISGSLSFDGSDKAHLREVFERYGVEIPEAESTNNWLKHAITGNLSQKDAMALATEIANIASDIRYKKNVNTVDVTSQYKPLVERVFNESYVHVCESLATGRQTDGTKQLIQQLYKQSGSFNTRYVYALHKMIGSETFSEDDSIVLHELLVYSTIEMMRSLHLASDHGVVVGARRGVHFLAQQMAEMENSVFQNMLSGFGAEGAKNNRTYSACGLSISAGEENDSSSPQSVFGGADAEKYAFNKEMYCVVCQAPPKEGAKKKWCGPCGICKTCDVHLKSKMSKTA